MITTLSHHTMPQPLNKAQGRALAIYKAYPRHVGVKDALKAIERAAKSLADDPSVVDAHAYLLNRATMYAIAVSKWAPGHHQYIPYPSTWFNRGSYADDPKEWERNVLVESKPVRIMR
jgi:hypothetical protein